MARVTWTIDDDVYEMLRLFARGNGMTIGAAANFLLRKGFALEELSRRAERGASSQRSEES
jgi:hypothetical protein